MRVVVVFAGALLVAAGVSAQAPAVNGAMNGKVGDPGEKICRIEDMTGSLFTQKICRTRAEWAKIDAGNAGDADRVFRMRRGINGRMGSPD